ncbi:ATP-binding protein [Sneathiella glossodoripedis]|uniref:ATP-binding protein n=1 Tax=Sneathiella glossodoripedis TaxID=418853 RepID=UPI00131F412F|nr:ATP-binding protein [Sneathiella glossodoripedis]
MNSVLEESRRVDNTPRDTLIGLASQTNYELHQLIYGLVEFQRPDSEISKQQLLNRFDVLWSREITNSSGAMGRVFERLEGASETLSILRQTLRDTEEDIILLEKGDTSKARKLADRYQELVPRLQKISTSATYYATDLTAQLYEQFATVNYWTMILISLMLLTSLLVAIIIWNERRALKNLARHLEDRVEERTTDLKRANRLLKQEVQERKALEEKLIQAQKMEVIGQLTGGIAHDFNNLLAIIQGNAELLLDYVDDRDKKLVKPILRSSQRGSELTSRLLAFSRKQALRPEATDITDHVNSMTELLDRSLGETINIKLQTDANLWPALVDPGQLENALLNLAVNARHAMPNGGTLVIEAHNETLTNDPLIKSGQMSAGDYICLMVSDNGVGMSGEVKAHAFEPFFTTKEVGKGSGLGLSMVYGFVQQSGGAVDIESTLGKGTTVKMYFPRSELAPVTNPSEEDLNPSYLGNGETVLILEDDLGVLELADNLLHALNYKTISLQNPTEVLNVAQSGEKIDAILSDVILPGGQTGPEFFEKYSDMFQDIPIIFMSGYPAEVTVNDTNGQIWDTDRPLLNKPFRTSELAQQLHLALKRIY